jgi:hypothetical protein
LQYTFLSYLKSELKYRVTYNREYYEHANFFEQTKREIVPSSVFYIREQCMFSFILEMDYFTMLQNRKYFWKAFYIAAPKEISGNKHFKAATVRECLTLCLVLHSYLVTWAILTSSKAVSTLHLLWLFSEAICKDGVLHRDLSYHYYTEHFCQCSLCLFYTANKCRQKSCSFREYWRILRKIWGSHSSGYEESHLLILTDVSEEHSPSCYLLHAGFLLGLFLYHEDGSDVFLRNVGWLSTDYTALYPRR